MDALFVIHQDSPLDGLASLCEQRRYRSILVLATHHPLPPEAARLRALAPDVRILGFGDLVGDEEAAAIDDRATRECLERLGNRARRAYNLHFMAASQARKNELAHRKLSARWRPGAVHYSPGLGIHGTFWHSVGGSLIAPAPGHPPARASAGRPAPTWMGPLRAWSGLTLLHSPEGPGAPRAFAFLGSTRRLRLGPDCRVEPLGDAPLSAWWVLRATGPGLRLFARLLARAIRNAVGSTPWALCTTIHEYRPRWSALADALGIDLEIFIDGHHPSNYPRTYLDMFLSGTFVVANAASAAWFRRHGRRTLPPYPFQKSERFTECRCPELRTVVLMANHAGDWTALINRSDSDLLIEAFAELAKEYPRFAFWIRLHPTMVHPTHEGVHSMERIHRYVGSLALPNLAVSSASLEEDLLRGDLFVSEYSQVLIDAWQRGKLGFAVNLTGRRSFMHDYERLGFIGVSDRKSLRQMIDGLPPALPELVARQNRAARRFNRLQRVWEGMGQTGRVSAISTHAGAGDAGHRPVGPRSGI